MKNCIQNIQEPRPNRATCDLSENKLAVDYVSMHLTFMAFPSVKIEILK